MVSWPSTSEPLIAGWTMSDVVVDQAFTRGSRYPRRAARQECLGIGRVERNEPRSGIALRFGLLARNIEGLTSASVREAGLGANVDGDEVIQYVPSASNSWTNTSLFRGITVAYDGFHPSARSFLGEATSGRPIRCQISL
jgi:hypothetical protein